MQPRLARPSRGAAATFTFLSLLVVCLGTAWALSRVQYRERPRWEEAAFPRLGDAAISARTSDPAAPPRPGDGEGPPVSWREHWIVAVHPGCPHCRVSLESVVAARDVDRATVRLTALLVDTPEVPGDSVLATFGADELRWDRDGRWRRRWGHRVYGEVLCFDAAGKLRRTIPPFSDPNEVTGRFAAHGLGSRTRADGELPR